MQTNHLREISTKWGVSAKEVRIASETIKPHIHKTPVLTSDQMNLWLCEGSSNGTDFYFKAENFQKTGSFKIRGAMNAVCNLESSHIQQGRTVITHSAGNHGQALALAARTFKRDSYIIVPSSAPQSKIAAMKGYGAHIVFCKPEMKARVETAGQVAAKTEGVLVHPFEDPRVVAGQGTVAAEIMEQVPTAEAIIVSIGGGGLISGVALLALSVNPAIKIIGAEPAMCESAKSSLEKGERVETRYDTKTVADGVKASIGSIGWDVVKSVVHSVITVSEEDIKEAVRMVLERMKIVIEGAAGVAVAAARTEEFKRLECKKAVIVLCGGNVDIDNPPWH